MSTPTKKPLAAKIGLITGPVVALLIAGTRILGNGHPWTLHIMGAVAALMAIWWLTEAIPLAATAMIPLVVFPLTGIMHISDVALKYGHHLIFLFLGGFLVALAIERSGLHRRMALSIVAIMGDRPRQVVLGFMLATAFLSMWISNTASTLLMLPIAGSILVQAERKSGQTALTKRFGIAMMLGIAYAASIGGVATLIGTPPNLAFKGIYEQIYPNGVAVEFLPWMIMGVPFSASFLVVAWLLLTRWLYPVGSHSTLGGKAVIRQELHALGPMRADEWKMAIVFLTTALLWITRKPFTGVGWAPALGLGNVVKDSVPAMLMALVCCLLRSSDRPGQQLLDWQAIRKVRWDILLLFGGGLALAGGMGATGLDRLLGKNLATVIGPMSPTGRMFVLSTGMTFLTELTSNLASVNMMMPVLAGTADTLGVSPLALMLPTTLAASCAFMLPVATPPNAIVYGSGRVTIREMMKAGIWLNFVGVAWIVITISVFGSWLFGI